jgi:phage-related protein
MTTATNFPPIAPTFATPLTMQPRVIENTYGNGYRQAVGDGLNTMPESWATSFDDVSIADCETIDTFLRLQKGYLPFNWSPPDRAINKLLWSEAINLSPWSLSGATVTANQVPGPFGGSTTADKLAETSATGQHVATQPMTAVNIGDVWWVSCYAKAVERNQIWLTMYGEGIVAFDLNLGTVISNPSNYVTSVVGVGGGWYRCAVCIPKTNTHPDVYAGIWLSSAVSYTGATNSGVYLWGLQADLYPTLRPYQMTTGALFNAQYKCASWTKEKMSSVSGTVKAAFMQVYDL